MMKDYTDMDNWQRCYVLDIVTPNILSLTKTNGLGFKVSEILEGIKNAL